MIHTAPSSGLQYVPALQANLQLWRPGSICHQIDQGGFSRSIFGSQSSFIFQSIQISVHKDRLANDEPPIQADKLTRKFPPKNKKESIWSLKNGCIYKMINDLPWTWSVGQLDRGEWRWPLAVVCIFDRVLVAIISFEDHDLELKVNEEAERQSQTRHAKDDHDVVQTLHVLVIANVVVGAGQAVVVVNGGYLENEKAADRENGAKEFHGHDDFDE